MDGRKRRFSNTMTPKLGSSACTRPQISLNMAAINRMLVPLLFGFISSFITLLQLQVAYMNLQADHARRRLVIMRFISFPVNKTTPLTRLNRFTCLLGRFLHSNGLNYSNKADKTHTRNTQTKMATNSLIFAGLCLSQGACVRDR